MGNWLFYLDDWSFVDSGTSTFCKVQSFQIAAPDEIVRYKISSMCPSRTKVAKRCGLYSKRSLKMQFFVKLFFFGLITLLSYEAFAVIEARSKTQDIFSSILESDKIEIELKNLSEKRIKSLLTVQDPNFYEHSGYDFTTPGARCFSR